MKLHFAIPKGLNKYFDKELKAYRKALEEDKIQLAWYHLERAHILGQSYPWPHTLVHWLMLKFGFRIKNIREIIGQLPRLLVGGVKSFVGIVPVGNTGGADVPALKPMEIPPELREILSRYS